jgi:hypothetical protein
VPQLPLALDNRRTNPFGNNQRNLEVPRSAIFDYVKEDSAIMFRPVFLKRIQRCTHETPRSMCFGFASISDNRPSQVLLPHECAVHSISTTRKDTGSPHFTIEPEDHQSHMMIRASVLCARHELALDGKVTLRMCSALYEQYSCLTDIGPNHVVHALCLCS